MDVKERELWVFRCSDAKNYPSDFILKVGEEYECRIIAKVAFGAKAEAARTLGCAPEHMTLVKRPADVEKGAVLQGAHSSQPLSYIEKPRTIVTAALEDEFIYSEDLKAKAERIITGVGPYAVSATMLKHRNAKIIINAGTAASAHYPIGTIFSVEKVFSEWMNLPKSLESQEHKPIKLARVRGLPKVHCLSVAKFQTDMRVGGPDRFQKPPIVDMELYALATFAKNIGAKLYALKVVSDSGKHADFVENMAKFRLALSSAVKKAVHVITGS